MSPRFSAVLPHPAPTIDFSDCSAVSHPKPQHFRFRSCDFWFRSCDFPSSPLSLWVVVSRSYDNPTTNQKPRIKTRPILLYGPTLLLPCPRKLTRFQPCLRACELAWKQLEACKLAWTRMEACKLAWTQLGARELAWTQLEACKLAWTQLEACKLAWTRLDACKLTCS